MGAHQEIETRGVTCDGRPNNEIRAATQNASLARWRICRKQLDIIKNMPLQPKTRKDPCRSLPDQRPQDPHDGYNLVEES
eukprot:9475267-Pyramimonas_sp.AAC.1